MGQRRRPLPPPWPSSSSDEHELEIEHEKEEELGGSIGTRNNHGRMGENRNGGGGVAHEYTLHLLLHRNSCHALHYNFLGPDAEGSSCSISDDFEEEEVVHHGSDDPYDDDGDDCTTSSSAAAREICPDDDKGLGHHPILAIPPWRPQHETSAVVVEGDASMTGAEMEGSGGREASDSSWEGAKWNDVRNGEEVGDGEGEEREAMTPSLQQPWFPLSLPLWRTEAEGDWEDDHAPLQGQPGRPSSPPPPRPPAILLPQPSLEEGWNFDAASGGALRPVGGAWKEDEWAVESVVVLDLPDLFVDHNDNGATVPPPMPLQGHAWLWSSLLAAVTVLALYRWGWGWKNSHADGRRERTDNDHYDINDETAVPALPLRMAIREKWVGMMDVITTHWYATLGTVRDTIGTMAATTAQLVQAIVWGRLQRPPPLPPDLIVLSRITNGREEGSHRTSNGTHRSSKDNAVLEPSFLREEDYPDGWLVYHPTLGVVLKEVADQYDREAANGATPATPTVEPDEDKTDALHPTPHSNEREDLDGATAATGHVPSGPATLGTTSAPLPTSPPTPTAPSSQTLASATHTPDRQRSPEAVAAEDRIPPTSESNAANATSSTPGQLAVLRPVAATG